MAKESKIYITSLHLNYGGVEMMIASMANAFSELGYSVEVLCTYYLGEPSYHFDPEIKISYLTSCKPNRTEFSNAVCRKNPFAIIKEGLRAIRTLYLKKRTMIKKISSINSGVIISTRNEHSVLVSKYGNADVLKIAQLHNDHAFQKKLIQDFRKNYQNIDYFALLTPQTCQEVKNFMEGYNTHTECIVIPNFIEPPVVSLPSQRNKQVIAAGRLHPDKDFACLLRVWAQIVPLMPDWRLLLAGQGDLEEALKKQAREAGISDSVEFLGAIPHQELLKKMSESSCYAMTSVEESFGLVLVETMACATPPVAFDVRVGPRAIIDDGINGFLVEPGKEALFKEKLLSLMKSPELCRSMGEAAQEKAATFFKGEVIRQWEKILPKS